MICSMNSNKGFGGNLHHTEMLNDGPSNKFHGIFLNFCVAIPVVNKEAMVQTDVFCWWSRECLNMKFYPIFPKEALFHIQLLAEG